MITVEGLNSGGIVVDSDYVGDITNTGTIKVLGDNSVGISTQAVDGDITLDGTVTVVGAGAQDLVVNGDVSGSVIIEGAVSQATSFTDDDGDTLVLSRAALRTGAAAVEINGNVAGGIYVTAPDPDDDDDDTGTGSITSYGTSPAILSLIHI